MPSPFLRVPLKYPTGWRQLSALLPAFKINTEFKTNRTNKAAPDEPNHPQSISLHVCESVCQVAYLQMKSRLLQLIMVHNWETGPKSFIFIKYKSSQRPKMLPTCTQRTKSDPNIHKETHTHTYIKYSTKVMSPCMI